jgi:hypothetical protein
MPAFRLLRVGVILINTPRRRMLPIGIILYFLNGTARREGFQLPLGPQRGLEAGPRPATPIGSNA